MIYVLYGDKERLIVAVLSDLAFSGSSGLLDKMESGKADTEKLLSAVKNTKLVDTNLDYLRRDSEITREQRRDNFRRKPINTGRKY